MSGSGKSTAIRALEDAGFFCIDNLPVVLLPKLTELASHGEEFLRLALVIDAREGIFLKEAPRYLEEARRSGHQVEVLFLDSSDDSLLRRFSETRRRHPLAPQGSVEEGIARERNALRDLRELADQVIDTSPLNVHDLKRMVQSRFSPEPSNQPSISVMSFGYRYGVPPQADLVLDVRFLPNPYFVPELKGLTGRDPRVASYVLDRPETKEFLEKTVDLCRFLFPRYQREGKAYLTVALGCTGGKHRSVAIAAELVKRLATPGMPIHLWDRDIEKE
ncbi:MAG: RNase adapter RapZ [Myxococcaceae bacterium]|nr:RNase adapter RapZ [Myxococcaceae bacterium]